MRKVILTTIICLGIATASSVAQNLLNGPETILFDEARDRYLVSNMNTGNVVQIDRYGSYTVFYSGIMSHCYGLHIVGDTLFAGSNFNTVQQGVVMLDLNTGEYLGKIRPAGMQFANDIASDSSGNIYVTDTFANKVFKIRLSDMLSSDLTTIVTPNGIYYDAVNDRLLVAVNTNSPVWAVNPVTGDLSAASAFYSVYDGFDEDRRHHLYATDSDLGVVFRFDSTLMAERVVVSSGHNVPEGIDFNILHSTLAVPNLFGNTIDFLPLDVDLWSSFDTTFGWAPLEVNCDAGSVYDVAEWIWNFGDGDTAYSSAPAHLYEEAGWYDVTLCAVTVSGDSIRRVYPGHISILADSLWAEDVEAETDGSVEVVIYGNNSVPVREIRFPVGYSGGLDLVYDSFSTAGCRTEFFVGQDESGLDESNQHVSFRLRTRTYGSPLFMEPGSGPILKVYFHIGDNPVSEETSISFDPSGAYFSAEFFAGSLEYVPELRSCTVSRTGCCGIYAGGITGNANCSDDGKLTLSDISRMIDYLYISKADLCCYASGNTNGSYDDGECKVTLSDISRLIDVLYISKQPPADCMPECER